MTKDQLITKVAKKLNLSLTDTRIILNEILSTIITEVSNGNQVKLRDFGVFASRNRKAKLGRNPQNAIETVEIPAKTVPVFSAGKLFKKIVADS